MEQTRIALRRRVFLLGALRLDDARGPRSLTSGKAVTLFSYLLLYPRVPHQREALAELLSPDAPVERVHRNFSNTLYRLRRTLGEGWLELGAGTVTVRAGPDLWVDVWEFEQLATSAVDADLERAVELYAGELVPEIYDEWILGRRELCRQQFVAALETLAAHKEAEGDLKAALMHTRRLLTADPLHEPAHHTYLRLLGRLQRYGEALAHYDYLCRLLRTELDAEPLTETRALARAIEDERRVASAAPQLHQERMPFVGRSAERALGVAAVEGVLAGRGGILAIQGEAGIGKSRLAREIAASARWRGVTVLSAAASETPAASPFQPLADALGSLLDGPRSQQLEALLPAGTLAALAPIHPQWRERGGGDGAPLEQAHSRFFSALHPFGETLARLTPLLLLLDDLQWADPALCTSLAALAPALAQHGALVLVAVRRPEGEATPVGEMLRAWDRAGRLKTIVLAPLDVEQVAELVSSRADADPFEIHALTEGSPFMIGEWLEGEPGHPAAASLTARRIRTLSESGRTALEGAAVLGESIPFSLWGEICELPLLTLAGIGEELTARHWLEPSPAGYSFVHDLLRNAAYDRLEPARRAELHERAARVLGARDPENARARAFHLDRAGMREEAVKAYREAAAQDTGRLAFREAQSALERALELMPHVPTPARVETALELAQVCEITSDHAHHRTAAEEAWRGALYLENAELLLQARLAMGRTLGWSGAGEDARRAKAHLSEALALARERKDTAREIQALFELGNLASKQGDWGEARKYYAGAEERMPTRGERSATLEEIDRRIQSSIALQIGALPDLIKELDRELTVERRAGNRLNELGIRMRLLGALYNLSAWDRLSAIAKETLPLAEEVGDRFKTATVQYVQGMAAYCLGDYTGAQDLFGRAHEGYVAVNDLRSAGLAINMLGLVAEGKGEHERAVTLLVEAVEGATARETTLEAAYARHDLGALRVRLGQFTEAISLLEAARAAWTEQNNLLLRVKSEAFLGLALLGARERARAQEFTAGGVDAFRAGVPPGEQAQAWLWALYRLCCEFAPEDIANAVLRAAYDELQRQARTIGDHALRKSFFERVELNREIVNAYDRLTSTVRVLSRPLARRGAPLGRALTAEEFVTVQWMIRAPEDEVIADKTERRRHCLGRLLREAQAQDAAPTDDDLAHALGVSRRTILRDMQALAAEATMPSTRKRK